MKYSFLTASSASMDLFNAQNHQLNKPLAETLRPKNLNELLGQKKVLGPQSKLGQLIRQGFIPSLILWGPPGTGKTSFALALADLTQAHFAAVNAVDCSVKDLREISEKAKDRKTLYQQKTILFVDEIHRFNKSQQDVLLPFVEQGWVTLIGATTENPSYEINKALLSRARVIPFERLAIEDLKQIITKAEDYFQRPLTQIIDESLIQHLLNHADGDARRLINNLEIVYASAGSVDPTSITQKLSLEDLQELLQQKHLTYDKSSQDHYNLISAMIKSVRGSDPDAAMYYMVRMLEGGEDPLFIARRLLILASEDIGNADPRALSVALAGLQTVEAIGLPECKITLAQVCTYLSSCPKSNASYKALHKAQDLVRRTGALPVAEVLQSPKNINYQYPHDFSKAYVAQNHWPEGLPAEKIYQPSSRGFEKNISDYLTWIRSEK
ncbi:MAG: replication-associated recombination protein A [Pseudobdellovibrionaceae bacterium]